MRLIVLDTLEPGRHGGGFCEARAAWLKARLAEQPDMPTMIVMHHPPFDVGIDWMDTDPDEPWVERFADAIAGQPQIQAILCGHLHRAIVAPWKGVTVDDLPLDRAAGRARPAPDRSRPARQPADGDRRSRPATRCTAGASHGLVTHFETAEDHVVLAKFDSGMQPLVRSLIDERPR